MTIQTSFGKILLQFQHTTPQKAQEFQKEHHAKVRIGTACRVLRVEEDKTTARLCSGLSVLKKGDNFSKSLGRKYALTSAMRQAKEEQSLTKDQRREIWAGYFAQVSESRMQSLPRPLQEISAILSRINEDPEAKQLIQGIDRALLARDNGNREPLDALLSQTTVESVTVESVRQTVTV